MPHNSTMPAVNCKLGYRSQGRFQLGDGWKAFAQQWGLAHGEQVQLSRRFVSSGCIWLDVQLVREDPAYAASGVPQSVQCVDVSACWRVRTRSRPSSYQAFGWQTCIC